MPTAVQKVGPKFQVTIARPVRERLGLKAGDLVEVILGKEGAIVRPVELRPRKVDITRRLEVAERAVAQGRVIGPFKTAPAAMRALKKRARGRGSH